MPTQSSATSTSLSPRARLAAAPTQPPAPSTSLSPRARLAAALPQKLSALARVIGCMKLTEAPPSTQSMSTSERPRISCSPIASSARTRIAQSFMSLFPAARPLVRDHYDVARGFARAIPEHHLVVELHGEAVVFVALVRHLAERDFDAAFLHPDLLMDARVARAALVRHACAGGKHDVDELDRRR